MPTNQRTVPTLRFPEFSGEWEEKKLGEILTIGSGRDYKHLKEGEIPVFGTGGLMTKVNDFLYDGETVCIGRKGTIDNPMYFKGKIWTVDTLFYTHSFTDATPKFVYNLFLRVNWKQHNEAGGVPSLSKSTIEKIHLNLPSLPEQKKIASFLTIIDAKTKQLTRKKTLVEQYKKAVMQQLFSQKLRFRDNDGEEFADWEEKKLNKLLFETKQRNNKLIYTKEDVLSVSGEFGVVNQIDFMGRSYAGESVDLYHVVRTGDIVYTKSPLKSNPYGIIKANKGANGIVSTLYAVYGCYEEVSSEYLDYYFQLDDNTNSYLRPLVHKGAKNDMKINNAHVLTGKMKIPPKAEQLKIVSFIEVLNDRIRAIETQINLTKTYKKGLLQQLFV